MVRAGDHWTDRTTIGHIRAHMNSDMTYEVEDPTYDRTCFEGIMQYLYDQVHISATEGWNEYKYTWLADEVPTEFTIEKVASMCVGCFLGCNISTETKDVYLSVSGKRSGDKKLLSHSLLIDWSTEEDEEESDEEQTCSHCDKPGHSADDCHQSRDINGHKLDGGSEEESEEENDDEEQWNKFKYLQQCFAREHGY